MNCPECGGPLSPGYGPESSWCGYCHGWVAVPVIKPPRLVWLRSNHVSYSAELPQSQLGPKGAILGRPDLEGFKWESWPG